MSAVRELIRAVTARIEEQRDELAQARAVENREENITQIVQAGVNSKSALADYHAAQTAFDADVARHAVALAAAYRQIVSAQNLYINSMTELAPTSRNQSHHERNDQLENLFAELERRGFDGCVVQFDSWQMGAASSHGDILTPARPNGSLELRFGDLSWSAQQRAERISTTTKTDEEINHAE